MYDLIDCKKQSHDTHSSTEHQLLDQCKTKRTESFFKCCEGHTLNNRRSSTGDELQSFDVFGKHLATSDLFQKYDRKDTCDKPYKFDICDEVTFLTYRITLERILVITLINVIYVMKSDSSLQDHIRTHTGDKTYKCDICGKGFNKNSSFQNDIRSHTCDKLHKSDIYSRVFSKNSLLQTHIRTHTVINLIIVMYVVKYLIRILAYRNTLEHIYW
jgi:hypothetical protein